MTDQTHEPDPTAVYRMFGQGDRLLYVGASHAPLVRIAQHADDRPWWRQVDRISLDWFPCRESALAVEKSAIERENPAYNVAHNDGRFERLALVANLRTAPLSDAQLVERAIRDGMTSTRLLLKAYGLPDSRARRIARMIRAAQVADAPPLEPAEAAAMTDAELAIAAASRGVVSVRNLRAAFGASEHRARRVAQLIRDDETTQEPPAPSAADQGPAAAGVGVGVRA